MDFRGIGRQLGRAMTEGADVMGVSFAVAATKSGKGGKAGKKSCKKGLPCGGSCIAANKKCKSELPEKTKPLVEAVKKVKPDWTFPFSPSGVTPPQSEVDEAVRRAYLPNPKYDAKHEKIYRDWLAEQYKAADAFSPRFGLRSYEPPSRHFLWGEDGDDRKGVDKHMRDIYEISNWGRLIDSPPPFKRKFSSSNHQRINEVIQSASKKPLAESRRELNSLSDTILAQNSPTPIKGKLETGEKFTGHLVGNRGVEQFDGETYRVLLYPSGASAGIITGKQNAFRFAALADAALPLQHKDIENFKQLLTLEDDAVHGRRTPTSESWNAEVDYRLTAQLYTVFHGDFKPNLPDRYFGS